MMARRKATDPDRLHAALKRLDAWFEQHRPRFWRGLNPPATAEELRAVGRPLPAALRVLLSWHNGQSMDFVGAFEESWFFMGTDRMETAIEEVPPACVPFLNDDAGSYRCLDASGAVVDVTAGEDATTLIVNSLTAWIWRFTEDVEQGRYVEDEERGQFLRRK